jgi:inner membrane transporter RhtA
MAMLVASIVVTPIGLRSALGALLDPMLLLAGAGVGVCSSVIPYICDQLAMARLSKATFALMLSLLPATACLVGIVVLRQVPSRSELIGVGAVIAGVALKRSADD